MLPAIGGLSPASATVGSGALTLTVNGTNFAPGAVARWNGAALVTTVVSTTQLTAAVSANLLTAAETVEITIATPDGTSAPRPFFVTAAQAPITVVDSGTSTTPGGTATGSVGGSGVGTAGSVSATASGSGTVTVAQYAANPVAPPPSGGTGTYADVHLSADSHFTSVAVVNCNLNGGTVAYWWDGTAWALVTPQSYNASTGCITITLTASSSPSLGQLTGTYFASAKAAGPTLTIAPVPAAQGTISASRDGDRATLTTTPASGQLFLGWKINGAAVSTWINPLVLNLTADTSVEATFAARPEFKDATAQITGAAEAIAQLAARGIIKGCDPGAGRFCPTDPALRAQMAALIVRAMGWGGESASTPFSDRDGVDDELWHSIGILAAHGVARGYGDGTYGTTGPVLNAQVISFITRAMVNKGYWQSQPDDGRIYPNVPGSSGHRQDLVTYAHYAGAVRGTGSTTDPFAGWDQSATRAYFAFALWQALDSYFGH